jgi:putative nucleotidyltransferase with HDIG domain
MNQLIKNGFYTYLETWLDDFISSFERQYPQFLSKFNLKRVHSQMVADEIITIAKAIGLKPEDTPLAKVIGLLHDIGRFPQFAGYTTFDDRISVDHGALGVDILSDYDLLASLDLTDRIVVETAILHHNKARLPDLADKRCHLYAQLIRDADKLDIFRVVKNTIDRPGDSEISTLPKGDDISEKVLTDVTKKEAVCKNHIKNQIDWIFFRIAWFFDINFSHTLKLIMDRGYYKMLRSMLPETDNIIKALNTIDSYLTSNLPKILESSGKNKGVINYYPFWVRN